MNNNIEINREMVMRRREMTRDECMEVVMTPAQKEVFLVIDEWWLARTNDPDSATSQFFINLVNNDYLNFSPANPGYTVFGKVIEGLDVVDKIGAVKTTTKMGHEDVPIEPITILSAKIIP